uniref:Uncharacterized protein n=1 Tax=Utricularia reniformis TaxID=192314 RepID=A0A1Y0B0C9_9LAMI|nr:hypothetical protein AEK19_MT0598 [Utricularia reniformis]ART30853.1 hypothetical protein AEK19_MT0598 [Utricularia reniformis]
MTAIAAAADEDESGPESPQYDAELVLAETQERR